LVVREPDRAARAVVRAAAPKTLPSFLPIPLAGFQKPEHQQFLNLIQLGEAQAFRVGYGTLDIDRRSDG
jgi:hypothetical protein